MEKNEKEGEREKRNQKILVINGKKYIKCAVKNCSNLIELTKGVKIDGDIFCPSCATKMILFSLNFY